MSDTDQITLTEAGQLATDRITLTDAGREAADKTTPTEGQARLALETGPCVVAVGEREVCECYQDGEEQTHEDQANAVHIVKLWNSEPIIRQAILIIGMEAEAARQSCMIGDTEWACQDCTSKNDCAGRQSYARMMGCYADLKTLVRL